MVPAAPPLPHADQGVKTSDHYPQSSEAETALDRKNVASPSTKRLHEATLMTPLHREVLAKGPGQGRNGGSVRAGWMLVVDAGSG